MEYRQGTVHSCQLPTNTRKYSSIYHPHTVQKITHLHALRIRKLAVYDITLCSEWCHPVMQRRRGRVLPKPDPSTKTIKETRNMGQCPT